MKELVMIFGCLILLSILIGIAMKRYNDNKRYIQEFELREIEYNCKLINEMWNKMTNEERKRFWGEPITSIPSGFLDQLYNINKISEIPEWCFH